MNQYWQAYLRLRLPVTCRAWPLQLRASIYGSESRVTIRPEVSGHILSRLFSRFAKVLIFVASICYHDYYTCVIFTFCDWNDRSFIKVFCFFRTFRYVVTLSASSLYWRCCHFNENNISAFFNDDAGLNPTCGSCLRDEPLYLSDSWRYIFN